MSIKNLLSAKSNLHHAYLIEGDKAAAIPEIISFLASIGVTTTGNPNLTCESYENFGIEDSRNLKARQIEKGAGEGKKIFIISADFILREAQNALLKVFEEPAADTHFFMIVPRADLILDTLKSRFEFIRSDQGRTTEVLPLGREFLAMGKPDRLEYIKDLIKKHEDDESGSPLKIEALDLVNSVERELYKNFNRQSPSESDKFSFEELHKCREYLTDRGASVKMLLEHLALILPII